MPFIYKPRNTFDTAFVDGRCSASVSSSAGWGSHQCARDGKYPDEDGNLWCKQHHPDTVKTKREAEDKKRESENEAMQKKWVRETAEKEFCARVSTEYLQSKTLIELIGEE